MPDVTSIPIKDFLDVAAVVQRLIAQGTDVSTMCVNVSEHGMELKDSTSSYGVRTFN